MEIEVEQRRYGHSDLARWLDEGSTACGGTGELWKLIEHDMGRYVTAQSSRSEEERIGSRSSLTIMNLEDG